MTNCQQSVSQRPGFFRLREGEGVVKGPVPVFGCFGSLVRLVAISLLIAFHQLCFHVIHRTRGFNANLPSHPAYLPLGAFTRQTLISCLPGLITLLS